MNISLEVATGTASPRRYRLCNGRYTIGSGDCDIVLSYPTVSRRHGLVTLVDGVVSYTDLSSRNGSSLLQGDQRLPIASDLAAAWTCNARIGIGPFTLGWNDATAQDDTEAGDQMPSEAALQRHGQRYARLMTESPGQARDLFFDQLEADPLRQQIIDRVHREYHGNGPLHHLLGDPACREIIVNAYNEIYVDLGSGLNRTTESFLTLESFEAWTVRTAHEAGRRLDLQHPICEATLPNGARFHAVMPPVSVRGISVAIRRFGSAPIDEFRALEQGRAANADGIGQVALRQLVQCALRMRPDRIIVGECRGSEVLEMLQALNTGHPGSLTTVHANSTEEAVQRLELLALL
ncbi:MAG: Flp pilus assembly complex ATPase component TadA, partial [Deltaproteobacteria bacterium]|nr:Flp pilus assembly complex ATPase component TadA [Deltaproteobacteria bacterium]